MKVTKRRLACAFISARDSAKRVASIERRSVTKPLSWAKLQKSQVALHRLVTEALRMAGPPLGTRLSRSIRPERVAVMRESFKSGAVLPELAGKAK